MNYNIPSKEETIKDLEFAIANTNNDALKIDYQRMIDSLNTRMVEGSE